MKQTLLCIALFAVGCGPSTSPYEETKTEWDDVGAALVCNPDDVTQNCLEPKANTVRIDDEARLKLESASWDEATGTFTARLKAGEALDPRVKVGTILYRGRKDRRPLLHRVDELTVSGQDVTAKLTRVTVKDAFKKGRIRTRLFLTEPGSMGQPLTGKPGQKQEPLEIALGPSDCSGNVLDGSVVGQVIPGQTPATGNVKLDLTKCRFRLKAWVDAVLQWDEGFANLDKFELSVGGEVDAAMHARLQAVVTGGLGFQTRIWEGPEIPFTVAGIIITVNPSLFAGFNVDAEANLVVEQGFDMTDGLTVGFGYSDRLDWYSIDERNSQFTDFGPNVTFEGRLNATAYVLPRLDVKAFGVVGATVTLKTFAEAKLRSSVTGGMGMTSGELCRSLTLGVAPAVGAVIEVLGLELYNDTMTLTTARFPLVQNRCTPFTGTVPTNCDPSSECCLDAQCPVTEPGTTTRCKKGMELSPGLFRYRCVTDYPMRYCTDDAQCDDMSIATTDRCDDYSCSFVTPDAYDAAARATTTTASICLPPSCCQENSDCADGRKPNKRCIKPGGASASATGSCQ